MAGKKKSATPPRGSGSLAVPADVERRAREKAQAKLDEHERTRKQKKHAERTARRPAESPFVLLGGDPSGRYQNALRELRSLRHGFARSDGYGAVGKLTDSQRRQIRKAFNATRAKLAQPHTLVKPSQIKDAKPGDFDAVLREFGQRAGSRVWKKAIVPVPAETAAGKKIRTTVQVQAAFRQTVAPGKRIRYPAAVTLTQRGILIQRFPIRDVFELIGDMSRRELAETIGDVAPDAKRYRLLFANGVTGWHPFTRSELAAELARIFEDAEDKYGDPSGWLTGFVAYTPTKQAKANRYSVERHTGMERDRRVLVTRSKKFWADAHRSVGKKAGKHGLSFTAAQAIEAQGLADARRRAGERGLLQESELWDSDVE